MILIALVTIPLLGVFVVAVPLANITVYRQSLLQVETISDSLENQIYNWVDNGTHVADELSLNDYVRHGLQTYQSATTPDAKQSSLDELTTTLQTIARVNGEIWAIDLLDPQSGDVVTSNLFAERNKNYATYDFFQSVISQTDNSIDYFIDPNASLFYVTIPIKGDDGSLQTIGVVQMDLSNLNDVLHTGISPIATGRAYLVNQTGDYLTHPQYHNPQNIKTYEKTMGALQAIKGVNGTSIYKNIENESVLGVYHWLADVNLGLIVEMDEDSYTGQTTIIERWIALVALIMLVLVIVASRVLNRYLTAPLLVLSRGAKEFQAGNFHYRLEDIGNDEFGNVAQALNHMADNVQKSHENLSTMVEQRTSELQNTNSRLLKEMEQRSQIEENLKSSEEKFRVAFLTSPDAVSISLVDNGLYVDINEGFTQITGYSHQELIGKTSSDINIWVNPDDRVRLVNEIEERGRVENLSAQFRKKDGTVVSGLMSANVIMIDGVAHLLSVTKDITPLQLAQDSVKISEMHYRQLFEDSPISLWEEDLSEVKLYLESLQESGIGDIPNYLRKNADAVVRCGELLKVLDINLETLKLFKASKKEDVLSVLNWLFEDDDFNTLRNILIAFWRGETKVELDGKWQTLQGEKFHGRIQISILPAYLETWGKVLLSIFDITPQVRARESLDRRNQELSVLNRIISASVVLSDPESILELSCRELTTLFSVPHAAAFMVNDQRTNISIVAEHRTEDTKYSLLGQNIPATKNPIIQYLANYQAPMLIENVKTDKRLGSSAAWLAERNIISLMISPLMINNIVVGAIAVADAVPRKFATTQLNMIWGVTDQLSGAISKMKLTHQNQRLIAAVEQIAESIIITDIDANILYVNPIFEKTTQYNHRESFGKSIFELYADTVPESEMEERRTLLLMGKTWHGRIESHTKTGDRIIEEETISPLRGEHGKISGFIFVRRNITREMQLEEQYHQAQKMEAIGRLTGGISHDFNNILTAINGFAELMLRRPSTDEWQHKMAQNILGSGQKAADLVRQLLVFSRKKSDKTQVINLNDVVSGMEKILSRVIGEYVEIDTQMSENLWNIEGDTTQFEQVILNLAVNARDAIADSGSLILKTENFVQEPEYIRAKIEIPAGNYVLLTVTDNGAGMSDETKEHIFEPFFTTKESQRGTGLGLATVYGIVQQSAGFISVESEMGQGTAFKIYLPATDIGISEASAEADINGNPELSGHETILLAEDEELVRDMARRFLEQYGYTVLEAVDGVDAMRIVEERSQDIDLLLTDVVMPKLNGIAMSKQFAKIHPQTPILYMSGYMDDVLREQGMIADAINFLSKPFSPDELLKKIRIVLSEANGE